MNSSTLPPLLSDYLPEYEPKRDVLSSSLEHTDLINEKLEVVKNDSNEIRKKPKHRKVMSGKHHNQIDDNSIEQVEKAFHTLKMWNIVKKNEHKRKEKMLKDRIKLQQEMIRKQDELSHEKNIHYELEREKKKSLKKKNSVGVYNKVQHGYKGNVKVFQKNKRKIQKPVVIEEIPNENEVPYEEEDNMSEISQQVDELSDDDLLYFTEKSTMEDADFSELQREPLNVQLERLFGDDADRYLNPTVKENSRKQFDLSIARNKGHQGAAELWDALRAYSRQKLINKDVLILPDVKNAYACFVRECLRRHITPVKRNFVSEEENPMKINLEESEILKNVKYRRNLNELMYRVAHMNQDKTKLLLQITAEAHYTKSNDEDGIRRYYPMTTAENDEKPGTLDLAATLPDIQLNSLISRKTDDDTARSKQRIIGKQSSGLLFLTERKAKCKGEFSKRLKKDENSRLTRIRSGALATEKKSSQTGFLPRVWEPLSMQALLATPVTVVKTPSKLNGLEFSQIWNTCS